ncbi:MAG: hypothetical protein KIG85_09135 [Thiopseudomonas sp.]|nr:hypothetical protein [Thiopseudomonas sp.]
MANQSQSWARRVVAGCLSLGLMASAWAQVDIDRLTQEVDSIHGTTTYQYDANGNLTQKTNGASTTTYSWNSDNRLIEVQTGSTTIRYGYDPQGRRIKRLKTEGSDKEETHYILDTQRAYHDIVIERTRRNSDPWQETSYLFTPRRNRCTSEPAQRHGHHANLRRRPGLNAPHP